MSHCELFSHESVEITIQFHPIPKKYTVAFLSLISHVALCDALPGIMYCFIACTHCMCTCTYGASKHNWLISGCLLHGYIVCVF